MLQTVKAAAAAQTAGAPFCRCSAWGAGMNDQSFQYSVDTTHPVSMPQAAWVETQAMSRPFRKRFQRGASRRAASLDTTTQTDDPIRTLLEPSVHSSPTKLELTPYQMVPPALDDWNSLPPLKAQARQYFRSGASLANFVCSDPAARGFDLLRTRLLQTLRENGWSRIAIASPTHGCGATFTAMNLAQSLARIPGSRTVLMDINHRKPGIAGMLGMDGVGDMRGYLSGDVPMDQHLLRASNTLALGLADGPDPRAAEILHDARCGETLNRMTEALHPDVVLYDLPPVLVYDDLAAFLPQVDGVLLVADGTQTQASHIAACEKILEGQTQVLGVILNRARKSGMIGCET